MLGRTRAECGGLHGANEEEPALRNAASGTIAPAAPVHDPEFVQKQEQEKLLRHARTLQEQLCGPVICELCNSISHSLSSTTEPLSKELLGIRESCATFLATSAAYDDDIKEHRTMTVLEEESGAFNKDLDGLAATIQNVFSLLDDRMTNLKTVSSRIEKISVDIGEISAQIRLLSFNASIEAVRAGAAGAGFRIIAGEIKRLSADTETKLSDIKKTLKETNGIFGEIGRSLKENETKVGEVIDQRQKGFDSLSRTLEGYFPKLESLYEKVTGLINTLSESMDVISPVVQLHEITSQEIGNVTRVIEYFGVRMAESETKVPHDGPDGADCAEIETEAREVRRFLTTEDELHALERGIQKVAPGAHVDLSMNTTGIQLF
jgi:archaellum component FlaC